MKKLAIMAILAIAAISASATDLGLRAGRIGGVDTNAAGIAAVGVTVGQQFGVYGAELAFDRANVGTTNLDRYSLVGSYDVTKIAGATVALNAGAAYIRPTIGTDGYAALVGVGISYPLTKTVSLVADYAYQAGQARVNAYNGNTVSIGTKYSF